MLSKVPKNKPELIRSIQSLHNPKLTVYEVFDKKTLSAATKKIENDLRRNPVTLVVIDDN